jgi:uncharacterized membrane protein
MSRLPLARVSWGLAMVGVLAGLVHLTSLLAIPPVAQHDAYARVEALGQPFVTVALPPASPTSRAIPFADPAVAASVCLYDLSLGPVRARAPLGRAGFAALSFHSRRGVVYFALTDRAANKGRMEALIVTPEQLRSLISRDDEDNPSEDLRIVSPTPKGFVMARVLSDSPDLMPAAQAQAAAMTCESEPIGDAEK